MSEEINKMKQKFETESRVLRDRFQFASNQAQSGQNKTFSALRKLAKFHEQFLRDCREQFEFNPHVEFDLYPDDSTDHVMASRGQQMKDHVTDIIEEKTTDDSGIQSLIPNRRPHIDSGHVPTTRDHLRTPGGDILSDNAETSSGHQCSVSANCSSTESEDSSSEVFHCPNCRNPVHGGPKGDVCLGKLKCHHYICISCFSDVKFHSKCQICHKSFKKNDIKFEYLSPNSN